MKITEREYAKLRPRVKRATFSGEASVTEISYAGSSEKQAASQSNVARFRGYSKYGAKAVEIDGVRFASKAEGRRYRGLKTLEASGMISNLELQPRFPFDIGGELMFTYIADFAYKEEKSGKLVIEDVKGVKTPVYKLKKKIIEKYYGVSILETRGSKR